MKKIKEFLDVNYIKQVQMYLNEGSLFLDIETLGLSHKYHPIYLIGIIYYRDGELFLCQYLAENPDEEKDILIGCFNDTKDAQRIITFNGNSFDLPYIEKRADIYGLKSPYNSMDKIDLLKIVKCHKNALGLSRCNQTTLECFLGIDRLDEYDGGRLIPIYNRYAKFNNSSDEELLLLHNYEDIKGMISLLSFISYDRICECNYSFNRIEFIDESEIIFEGCLDSSIPKPIRIIRDYIHFKISENQISGTIHLKNQELKLFFKNTKDYVYLPLEDQIVPKELSSAISSDRKTKATKKNCYIKRKGLFLPIPKKIKLSDAIPLFRENYDSKDYFILVDNKNSDSQSYNQLSDIIACLTRALLIEER